MAFLATTSLGSVSPLPSEAPQSAARTAMRMKLTHGLF